MPSGLPFAATRDGLRVAVRLSPRAAMDRVMGLAAEADGGRALKVAVTAAPEDGKANEALLRLLARVCGVPRRDLAVVTGRTDRRKVVHVAGDPAALAPRLEEALSPWLTLA